MFWKSARDLGMWDWEVLTRLRKATEKLPYSSQENGGESLKKN